MQETLNIIGFVIFSGIVLGIAGTAVIFIAVSFFNDPDFEDEDDREIYEHKYWNKKK